MGVKKAIFLDKDGTLIPDIPFNVNTELIQLSYDAAEGLQVLQQLNFIFVVISNQPGIARGYFSHEDIIGVGQKLDELLGKLGVSLSGFYYCPHETSPLASMVGLSCKCRKPKPGLFYMAAKELNIDLSESWMIGDILNDTEAGNLAGCKTILIDNGNETEWILNDERTPDMIVPHINAAASFILDMTLQKIKYENLKPVLY
jgi:D-glycero-D-manno-heptose 1,7-bisphosphate phosphatase